MPTVRPTPATLPALPAHAARVDGRGLAWNLHGRAGVAIPYLAADLLDLTPADPLDLLRPGAFRARVRAGRVEARADALNAAIAGMLADGRDGPLRAARVAFLAGNRVAVAGVARLGWLPVPFHVRARLALAGPTTVRIAPETIRAFGLPLGWALRALRVDPARLLARLAGSAPAPSRGHAGDAPAALAHALGPAPGGAVAFDLARTGWFEGRLARLAIGPGLATLDVGDAPGPAIPAARREGRPNFCAIEVRGEAALGTAVIRDAHAVAIDATPHDPYGLNAWADEGHARFERGEAILTEAKLREHVARAGNGFTPERVAIAGTEVLVDGTQDLLAATRPVALRLGVEAGTDGGLRLVPRALRLGGADLGPGPLAALLATIPGVRRDGAGARLDLLATERLDLPPIEAVGAEPGRIVLRPRSRA